MDAASAFRGACLLAAAAGIGGSACGAAPAREGQEAAEPAGPARNGATARSVGRDDARITSGDPASLHARIAAVLATGGHECTFTGVRIACNGDMQRGAAFYVVYHEYPARLVFGSPWLLKGRCDDAVGAINEFNWAFDELHASCSDEGTVIVSSVYFIPEAGLTPRDVLGFTRWWNLSEVRALSSSKLGPLLR